MEPTPVIGANCSLILRHPQVNNGAACGFLLAAPEGASAAPAVAIQREASSDGSLAVRVFFEVLLAEGARAPNGAPCPWPPALQYARLLEFLARREGIELAGAMGVIGGLGALGHSATEQHFAAFSRVSCQFASAGAYFPPAPLEAYQNSLWDGARSWGMAFWR